MKKILISILILIILILGGGYFYLKFKQKKPLPDYNATIQLKNLTDEVTVYRDSAGVVHIIAQNKSDLYRTLGYVLAQDRLWQMDLIRRVTQGRISEIFGKDFVDIDLKLRALQIPQKSELIWTELDDSLKQILVDFTDGINQFLEENKDNLPLEFWILGYKPEKWQPQHSINLIGYMAWDLGMAWTNEIILLKIKQKLPDSLYKAFIPTFENDSTTYDFKLSKNFKIEKGYEQVRNLILDLGIYPFIGSNNWAVNSEKSADNSPILCNDMHLGLNIPGIWYQVHLITPQNNVSGVLIPGAPLIVAGHNDSIAWGMTNVMLDDADFYIETINSDTTAYLVDSVWKPLRIETEIIKTKEGKTFTKKLYFTHRGPIISYFKGLDKAVSMRWIGNEKSNEVKGVFLLNYANNWNDFRKACSYFGSVSQNIIYADKKGNIGLQFTGLVPKRKIAGYNVYQGNTTEFDWQGFIPFDSLPYEFNPKRGFVASANSNSAKNLPYYVSAYFYQDYRLARIEQVLSSKQKLSVDDMKKLQADQKSILVERFLPQIIMQLQAIDLNKKEKIALDTLKNWDGVLRTNSVAALIFEQFYLSFIKNSVQDELGNEIFKDFFDTKILVNNIFRYLWQNKNSSLFDNINTEKTENFNDILAKSFSQTIDTLEKQLGSDISKWNYGKLHQITLEHPLGKVKVLDFMFNLNRGPYAVGGSHHTVCPFNYGFASNFKVWGGASQRHIFTTSDWDKSLTVIPTGNSGQSADQFYCNQTHLYLSNKYHKHYFSKNAVEKNYLYKMKFLPKK